MAHRTTWYNTSIRFRICLPRTWFVFREQRVLCCSQLGLTPDVLALVVHMACASTAQGCVCKPPMPKLRTIRKIRTAPRSRPVRRQSLVSLSLPRILHLPHRPTIVDQGAAICTVGCVHTVGLRPGNTLFLDFERLRWRLAAPLGDVASTCATLHDGSGRMSSAAPRRRLTPACRPSIRLALPLHMTVKMSRGEERYRPGRCASLQGNEIGGELSQHPSTLQVVWCISPSRPRR